MIMGLDGCPAIFVDTLTSNSSGVIDSLVKKESPPFLPIHDLFLNRDGGKLCLVKEILFPESGAIVNEDKIILENIRIFS